jgi:AraC-like DNA-binding protein
MRLSDDDLARFIGYSARQVRRFAGHVLGEPLLSFARRLRLERAAGRLRAEAVSIKETGKNEGYETLAAFSESFFAWFGSPPSEFRVLNSSKGPLLPGYLLSVGRADEIPNHVQLLTRDEASVCLMYAGPILLGRRLPDGAAALALFHSAH